MNEGIRRNEITEWTSGRSVEGEDLGWDPASDSEGEDEYFEILCVLGSSEFAKAPVVEDLLFHIWKNLRD